MVFAAKLCYLRFVRHTDTDEVLLHLPLAADAELRAVDALDRLLARHQVERQAAGQARFALVEACLNAIEYAQPAPAAASAAAMDIRLAIRGGELVMSVGNPGAPFQPLQSAPSKAGRGHGLKIIRAFMDRVRYLNDAGGTRVEMSKRVPCLGGAHS
jgi:anti-sigma regulatory factor (Ser/Thr protein kinase)